MSKSIPAGTAPAISIERVAGDLSLVGWEGTDLLIKGDQDEVRFEQDGERFTFSSSADLALRVPRAASISIQKIDGDAAVRGVSGLLEIKEVIGDLSVRDINAVAIDSVGADFSLRGAKGNLSLKNAGSDVSARDVGGNVALGSVGDDLVLRDARGNVSANVGDDVVLYLDPKTGNAYSITAGDDILLVLPQSLNATLNLHGDEIHIELPGVKDEEDITERVITLGDGSAAISLNAGGDVRVTNRVEAGDSAEEFGNFAGINMDFSGLGDVISRTVEQATRHAHRARVDAAAMSERISERVERAAQRAQRKVEEAARRAEHRARDAERRSRRVHGGLEVGRWNWDFTSKGVPTPPDEPVSDEERMSILRMLQEKKITAEEAEKLLSALEGGF
jgi:hypothetical protein